jgi:hypothetical protein
MCVDCVLASPRIAQAVPGQRPPPRGSSVTDGWWQWPLVNLMATFKSQVDRQKQGLHYALGFRDFEGEIGGNGASIYRRFLLIS